MSDFKVGDEVILRERNRGRETSQTFSIVSVGRKYVYIERYGDRVAFARDTGVSKSGVWPPSQIFTPEGWAERQAWSTAHKRLRDLMRNEFQWTRDLSTKTLTAIADLIEGDAQGPSTRNP